MMFFILNVCKRAPTWYSSKYVIFVAGIWTHGTTVYRDCGLSSFWVYLNMASDWLAACCQPTGIPVWKSTRCLVRHNKPTNSRDSVVWNCSYHFEIQWALRLQSFGRHRQNFRYWNLETANIDPTCLPDLTIRLLIRYGNSHLRGTRYCYLPSWLRLPRPVHIFQGVRKTWLPQARMCTD